MHGDMLRAVLLCRVEDEDGDLNFWFHRFVTFRGQIMCRRPWPLLGLQKRHLKLHLAFFGRIWQQTVGLVHDLELLCMYLIFLIYSLHFFSDLNDHSRCGLNF